MADRNNLRTVVRGAYDVQKLRIQMGNRIVGNFKAKLGQVPGRPEEEMDAEGKAILKSLRLCYEKITDGVKDFPRQADFRGNEVISDYTELCLIGQYMDLEKHEDQHFRRLGNILNEYPIYTTFLKGVKGIGPAMAGVIISEIDISKAKYPSSLWAYAGLDVAPDGAGRSRRKEHLVQREYIDRNGKPAQRVGITFNPFLKTKLIGVLATSFLRVKDSPYAKMYQDYKHRLENHAKYRDGQTDAEGNPIKGLKGRRHNMAMRYMVKRFLVDLYVHWRKLEGLPVADEYQKAKLGHEHAA